MPPGGLRRVYPSNPTATRNSSSTTPHTSNDSSSEVIKKVRGRTRGKGLQKINDTIGKLPIDVCKDAKRPLNPHQSAKLTSELGVIARTIIKVPTKWRKVDNDSKQAGLESLKGKFDINLDESYVRDHCEARLKSCSRNQRYKLKKIYKSYSSLEEALRNCPENVDPEEWKELCTLWSDPKHEEQCAKNKDNRSKVKVHHTTGSRPYVIVHKEMCAKENIMENEEMELDGVGIENENIDAIELFKKIHYKEDKGWLGADAESAYEKMLEMKNNFVSEGETSWDPISIVVDVLGTNSSYVQSIGYAPKVAKPGSSKSKIFELEKSLELSNKEKEELQKDRQADKAMIQSQNEKIESQNEKIESILAQQAALIKALAEKGIVQETPRSI